MDSGYNGNRENKVITNNSRELGATLNNIVKISIAVGVLLVSLSVAYYFIFFLPSREKAKDENTKIEEAQRQWDLNSCLSDAQRNYRSLWETNCKVGGFKRDCKLPLDLANAINRSHRDEKDDCFKKFPKSN